MIIETNPTVVLGIFFFLGSSGFYLWFLLSYDLQISCLRTIKNDFLSWVRLQSEWKKKCVILATAHPMLIHYLSQSNKSLAIYQKSKHFEFYTHKSNGMVLENVRSFCCFVYFKQLSKEKKNKGKREWDDAFDADKKKIW